MQKVLSRRIHYEYLRHEAQNVFLCVLKAFYDKLFLFGLKAFYVRSAFTKCQKTKNKMP